MLTNRSPSSPPSLSVPLPLRRALPFHSLRPLSVGLAFLLALGCARRPEPILLDPAFSINIARVPKTFPAPADTLSEAQRQTLAKRGRPDFIRFWWNPAGQLVSLAAVADALPNLAESAKTANRTWIYGDEKGAVEVSFESDGAPTEKPLGEKLRLVCLHGDPDAVELSEPPPGGTPREIWTWSAPGIRAEFEGERLIQSSGLK